MENTMETTRMGCVGTTLLLANHRVYLTLG